MKEFDVNTFTPETFKEFCENPIMSMLMKCAGITENDLKSISEDIEKRQNNKQCTEESYEPETPVMENPPLETKRNHSDIKTVTLELDNNEVCSIVNKDEIKALLENWRKVDNTIIELDTKYGINLWDSYVDNFYSQYNKIIRTFLDLLFNPETADIMEDWTFSETPCDFDELWENLFCHGQSED